MKIDKKGYNKKRKSLIDRPENRLKKKLNKIPPSEIKSTLKSY